MTLLGECGIEGSVGFNYLKVLLTQTNRDIENALRRMMKRELKEDYSEARRVISMEQILTE